MYNSVKFSKIFKLKFISSCGQKFSEKLQYNDTIHGLGIPRKPKSFFIS